MESAPWMPPIAAVLVAAVAAFVLGGAWYSPALFGTAWQRLARLSDADLRRGNPALVFGPAFVLAFIAAYAFAAWLGPAPTVTQGLRAGATVGLCFVAASFAINDLFERRSLRLWAINAAYHVLTFVAFGLVYGLWPR